MVQEKRPKVLIMSGYGINCEKETKHAFELAGAEADIIHINDLISKNADMHGYDILMFPGGFSYGDDTGSGNAFANKIKNNLYKDIEKFIRDKKLILGICNGFQVMTNLGLFSLDGKEYARRIHAMEANTKARYECRWVNIRHDDSICVFTKGIKITSLPIAHGEGRFFCDDKTYQLLKENDQVVFRYCDKEGNDAEQEFPFNPNGSMHDIAGICDKTGRIMGMMPHPERAIYMISDPSYHLKREEQKRKGKTIDEIAQPNLMIFKNAVEYCKNSEYFKNSISERDDG